MTNPCMTVEWHRDGMIRRRFTVPARPSGLVGLYRNGVAYMPDHDMTRALLPYRQRVAFDRSGGWWQGKDTGFDVLHRHLTNCTGDPMGTLYARLA